MFAVIAQVGLWVSENVQVSRNSSERKGPLLLVCEYKRQQISLAFSSLLWLDPNKEISQGLVMSVEEKFLPDCR